MLDLTPEVVSLDALDAERDKIDALRYAWHGAYGIEGRSYCMLDNRTTSRRSIQLHCFAVHLLETDRAIRADSRASECGRRQEITGVGPLRASRIMRGPAA